MTALTDEWLDQALMVARRAAQAAATIIDGHYRNGVQARLKADDSPVTAADIEAESAIRQVLRSAFPDHAIQGEEQGREGESDFVWLVDPLDGTKSFVRRNPVFSTQIALMHAGSLVLGVSCASQFRQMAWARRGGGAFIDGVPVRVAETGHMAEAVISTGNLASLARGPGWSALGQLLQQANRSRGYGDFWHYHLLAQGSLDVVIESDVTILDIAALVVLVREAGGVFTDLSGAEPGLDTRSVLAATPALHARVLSHFAGWDHA